MFSVCQVLGLPLLCFFLKIYYILSFYLVEHVSSYNRGILKCLQKFNHPQKILQRVSLICVSRFIVSFILSVKIEGLHEKRERNVFWIKDSSLDYYHLFFCIEERKVMKLNRKVCACKKVFNLIRHFFGTSLNQVMLCLLFHGNIWIRPFFEKETVVQKRTISHDIAKRFKN